MSAKIKQLGHLYTFFCPACKYGHNVTVNGPAGWQWNLSLSKPTFRPSLMVNKDRLCNLPRCHSMITSGLIHFLEDSTHILAGKTVDLPDWQD